jgi:hypothetical protein
MSGPVTWRKTSYSGSDPYGNCVEVGALLAAGGAGEFGENCEEIARIERVRPHLRDLGDVAACDRRLAGLYARRDALAAGAGVAA